MGKCNCGAKPVVIKPKEKVHKIETNHINENNENKEKEIVQKTIINQRPNNFLLYLLLAGILAIIIILINRKC